jgi:cyclopropane fatty-acyl-phospholipid synthase-like methyltransferase
LRPAPNGRNATYLASLGCRVDAVDSSAQAIAWARDRASKAGVTVTFSGRSIFEIDDEIDAVYDLVYDSGCFHHLAPHRREDYLNLVDRALKPGGSFGLVCFRPEGGSGLTDLQVYQRASLGDGRCWQAKRVNQG